MQTSTFQRHYHKWNFHYVFKPQNDAWSTNTGWYYTNFWNRTLPPCLHLMKQSKGSSTARHLQSSPKRHCFPIRFTTQCSTTVRSWTYTLWNKHAPITCASHCRMSSPFQMVRLGLPTQCKCFMTQREGVGKWPSRCEAWEGGITYPLTFYIFTTNMIGCFQRQRETIIGIHTQWLRLTKASSLERWVLHIG